MAEQVERRETVTVERDADTAGTTVVERERGPAWGWLIAVIVVLLILAFLFGGIGNPFGGSSGSGADTDVNTPSVSAPQ